LYAVKSSKKAQSGHPSIREAAKEPVLRKLAGDMRRGKGSRIRSKSKKRSKRKRRIRIGWGLVAVQALADEVGAGGVLGFAF
jgi:hypothetical protein